MDIDRSVRSFLLRWRISFIPPFKKGGREAPSSCDWIIRSGSLCLSGKQLRQLPIHPHHEYDSGTGV